MADLSSLFTDVGPTAGAMYAGQQAGQTVADAQQAQQLRQAQLQEILQRTANTAQMAPLELQAKQQANDAAAFKAQQDKLQAHGAFLRSMVPVLEKVPATARHALLDQMATAKGLPLDEADKQHLYSLNGDQLVQELKDQQNWLDTQNERYKQAELTAKSAKESHIAGSEITAKAHLQGVREQIASNKALEEMRIGAGKYSKRNNAITDIQTAVQTGKMTPDKAATSFYAAAQFADNEEDRAKFTQMAQAYEKLAMNLKNAGAQGRPDVNAMTNGQIPTQTIPSALDGAPRGSAQNPIILK